MTYDHNVALQLLRLATNQPDQHLPTDQEQALRQLMEGAKPLLLIQPPGWGTTITALIATKLLRQAGMGPTLIMSPLITHVHQAIAMAERLDLRAAGLAADDDDGSPDVEAGLRKDEIDLLFVSADRFANPRVQDLLLRTPTKPIGLLVCEHVHTLCEASYDFRPQYRVIEQVKDTFPTTMRWLLTAHALNPVQREEVQAIVGRELQVMEDAISRPSLSLQTLNLSSQADRFAWLAEHVPALSGPGIIYANTKRDAYQVAEWLRSKGVVAQPHVATYTVQRRALEQAFLRGYIKVLVTTPVMGVAVHRPDLKFVLHYDPPTSLHDYYQQLGQAGTGHQPSYGIILSRPLPDEETPSSVPSVAEVQQILEALRKSADGLSPQRLAVIVNAPLARIRYALALFALESPPLVKRVRSRWHLAHDTLPDTLVQRIERLHGVRRQAAEQVRHYVELQEGHLEFLLQTLGLPQMDGHVPDEEAAPPLPSAPTAEAITGARSFLRSRSIILEPRKQWPPGGLPNYNVRGRMPRQLRAHRGKALCINGDSGWGELVAEGKRTGRFSDELIQACVHLYRQWRPLPQPQWVTCIPSRRHPHLVPDFAARLARALGLPFHAVFAQTVDRPPQDSMANSTRHALNIDGTLRLTDRPVQAPVLVVDDMVHSRWTFTVAAWLLRKNGVPAVFPLALAARYGVPQGDVQRRRSTRTG